MCYGYRFDNNNWRFAILLIRIRSLDLLLTRIVQFKCFITTTTTVYYRSADGSRFSPLRRTNYLQELNLSEPELNFVPQITLYRRAVSWS